MSLTRVLAPIDFSDDATLAARVAAGLARQFGAKLTVFHADLLPPFSVKISERVGADVWQAYLEARARAVGQRLGETVWPVEVTAREIDTVGADIDIPEHIVRHAFAQDVDLLVMASHGTHATGGFLLGSVTASVAAIATCPLLVLRGHDLHLPPAEGLFHRALIALASGEAHNRAMNLAMTLTARDAHVEMMHVFVKDQPALPALPAGAHEVIAEKRVRVRAEVERSAERLRTEGRKVSVRVEQGDPAAALLDRLAGSDYDLVVAGVRSMRRRSGVLGAVTQRLLQHSPVPVALFPVD